ncbi:hypothetical protein [Vibrio coralliilyticus]|uniref:hypothetical protein n=1 Tax=Vibrio coralliilyticus TaxID=190893 RepID=UPI000C1663A4|nr:hypothetical protein [Vibrio coralliilyticus]
MNKYKRTLEDLQANAVMHWSKEMLLKANAHSALPILLETQDDFIALLTVSSKSFNSWKNVLCESETLTPSIFLKHLMVLSDLGGEALNKLTPLSESFPDKKMSFQFNGQDVSYCFKEIGDECSLTNSALKVDAKNVMNNQCLTERMHDVIMLLLFGALDPNNQLPTEAQNRCNIGSLLGNSEEIETFVKQNYIRVSKQLAGEKANSLGHASQRFVAERLKEFLPIEWGVRLEATLSGVKHVIGDDKETNFDLVVRSPSGIEFGIEVSFQVTTNSTIERKAREAQSIYAKAEEHGHKVCYVIDGAGNLNVRKQAISTICENSHFTATMSPVDIEELARFMIECEASLVPIKEHEV